MTVVHNVKDLVNAILNGGTSIATAAIGIAVAGGGVSVLNKLREYDIKEQGPEHVILRKK